MNKELFVKNMETASRHINEDEIRRMVKDTVTDIKNNRDGILNAVIVMEELGELQTEISKAIRGRDNKFELIEEMADVWLGMYYLMDTFGIDKEDINRAINVKVERQVNRGKDF